MSYTNVHKAHLGSQISIFGTGLCARAHPHTERHDQMSLHGRPRMTHLSDFTWQTARLNEFTWKKTHPNDFTGSPSNDPPEQVYTLPSNNLPEQVYMANNLPE